MVLHDRSVVLEAWLKQKERWTCRLDDGTEINVRPDNLRPPKKRRGTPPHVPEEPPRKESMRGFFERQKKARILVNAADNLIRDPSMDTIRVEIDTAKSRISVWNNGKGLPIEIHKEHGCYVPELVFGHLLTSDNYNDSEKKVVGGRNGRLVGAFGWTSQKPYGQVAVALTNGSGFRQVSFVNSICTSRGGTHVNHVTEQVVARVMEEIGQQKSDKAGHLSVKPQHVRNHLWIFVNCLIENPAFDSQTKETLTTKKERFGSRCELSDDLLQGIVDWILACRHLRNKSDLGLQKRLFGIPKLEDANKAGTKDSQDCTLIITEGDSAKALAVAGLQVVGRDHYGVFPLRGKLRNVRELTVKQMMDNKEIEALMKIMAFDASKQYEPWLHKPKDFGAKTTLRLRVRVPQTGRLSSPDFDGSHIKGLVINFIQHWFPGLLRCEGFLREFVTPIVKVNNNGHGWSCKYYKGLGTSTAAEAKEYFSDLQQHELTFLTNDGDDALIDMAFNSKKADQRKEWISNCSGNEFVDHTQPTLTLNDFVQKELVAQFSGFVAEKSAYHHGESSLQGTIIGMAQNFVGSNNINLLAPQGQFGTRMAGGKDHAAARYIFTRLSRTARFLFPPDDDPVLEYQSEEGQRIEPKWYCPVLPMVLVNGAEGIGVGWSTSVPNYNPRDLIAHLRRRLRGQPRGERLVPWYRGFRGTVARVAEHEGRFETIGVIQRRGLTKIEVTELPVRRWTQDYKEWIMEQMHENNGKRAMISEFREHHTDNTVHFSLSMLPEKVATAEEKGFEKAMHLKSWISTSNMFLFDAKGKLKKYDSPEEILEEFAVVRLQVYQQRKEHRIRMVAEGELEVENRPAQQVCAELQRLGFRTKHQIEQGDVELRSPEPKRKRLRAVIPVPDQDLDLFGPDGYGYLLKMKMWTLTEERAAKLMEELEKLKELLKELRRTTLEEMWECLAERLSKKRQGHFEDDNSVNQQCVLLLSNSFSQIKRIRRFAPVQRDPTARWKGRRRGGRGKMLSRKGTTVEAEDEDELPDAINAAFVCREFDSLLAFTKAGHVFKLQALDVPLMQHKDVSMPIEELAPALPKDDGVTAVIAVPFALKESDILVMVSETGASLCFQAHQLRASTLKASFGRNLSG
eukprot:g32446.t1